MLLPTILRQLEKLMNSCYEDGAQSFPLTDYYHIQYSSSLVFARGQLRSGDYLLLQASPLPHYSTMD
jgi:hypothetical protein